MSRSKPAAPPRPVYIDRPEVSEVFADGVERLFFDGGSLRLEFSVLRQEDPEAGGEPKQWAYTAARVVLSLRGADDLINKMRHLEKTLTARGLLKPKNADVPAA